MKAVVTFIIFMTFTFSWLYILIGKIDTFNAQKNDIDLIKDAIPAIAKLLPHKKELIFNSSCIDGQQLVQYFQSQFVMAPDIILKNKPAQPGDTILIIGSSCAKDTIQPQIFKEILAVNKGALTIKLCVKQ
jgi:hypothetical protein